MKGEIQICINVSQALEIRYKIKNCMICGHDK